MAEAAEAVARLSLDAKGFDRQAKQSLESFTKQLRSVKDATDVAMRGAEMLQKVFIKSLGGTLVTGAAYALGDAMRDVGTKMSGAAQQAMDAQTGMKGLANTFQDAAARADKFNAAAQNVAKTIDEINENLLQKAAYNAANLYDRMFQGGSGNILGNLEQSLRGAADAELMGGSITAANRAKAIANMTPDQVKAYDLQQSRQAQIDAAKKLGPDYRDRAVRALRETFSAEDAAAAKVKSDASDKAATEEERKYQDDLAKAEMDASKFERLQSEQKARETADAQEAYMEKQNRQNIEFSKRKDIEAKNYYAANAGYDKSLGDFNSQLLDVIGSGLGSSRTGVLMVQQAMKSRAAKNKTDNFKYNNEKTQQFVDRMQKRGSGQSYEDFESYAGLTPDAARIKARKEAAEQLAKKTLPSDRDKGETSLGDIKILLENNLNELKKYAHVT